MSPDTNNTPTLFAGLDYKFEGIDEVLLVTIGCPNEIVAAWEKELSDVAIIKSINQLNLKWAPKDTLIVALWSDSIDSLQMGTKSFDIGDVLLSSTRVVGVFIDSERSWVVSNSSQVELAELSWIRSVSDMVVISSDHEVIGELVITLAHSALPKSGRR